jgi:hypothetical protein
MTRRRLLGVGVAVLATAGAALLFPPPRAVLFGLLRGEKFYAGRPTSHWSAAVTAYLDGPFRSDLVPATPLDWLKRLCRIGVPRYRPATAAPFHDPDPAAVPVLVDLLRDPTPQVRRYAAARLGALGPRARVAVPALLALLQDDETDRDRHRNQLSVRATAAWALREIDAGAADLP